MQIKYLSKYLILIVVYCDQELLVHVVTRNPQDQSSDKLTVSSRSFELGFVPIPKQPLTKEAWIEAFDLLEKHSEFILIHAHLDWKEFLDGSDAKDTENLKNIEFLVKMAEKKKLKLFIMIDPLSHDRKEIDPRLPKSFKKTFADEKTRQSFKNFAVRIATDYNPTILGLGSEINTFLFRNPDDAKHVISLFKETRDLVKKISPKTRITISFQFELLIGAFEKTKPQWDILENFEAELDAVAITTYPSPWFKTPAEMPDNYYTQLVKKTKKPIIIAESGWPTGGDKKYNGSESNQNKFLLRLVDLTKEVKLELWVWWFLHDWKGEGYPDFFKTMGLRTSDGKPKPSWESWQKITSLSHK